MGIQQVEAVGPTGSRKKLVKTAFERVWIHRGWRLAEDVDAEAAAEATPAEEGADEDSSVEVPNSGADLSDAQKVSIPRLRPGSAPE